MNTCADTDFRDFQIVDTKVDIRHMAVNHLVETFKDVDPIHADFPSRVYSFPLTTFDHVDQVNTRTKTQLGVVKHDIDMIPHEKSALIFPESYLRTAENLVVILASVPNSQDGPTPVDFQPRPDTTDQNNGVAKRNEALRWLHQPAPASMTPLANLTDVLSFHTYLHALGSDEVINPTWVDHPADQAELDVHNSFWTMYYDLAKRIDMKQLDHDQHNFEKTRQPILVRGVYAHSLNNLITTLLVCPYDIPLVNKAHGLLMDDMTLLPSSKALGHNLFHYFTTVYLGANGQYTDLSKATRKTSTVEFVTTEAKKVRAFEDAANEICADVALKLEVLAVTYHTRMILYDDLSQVYHMLDKATLSAITTDLGCSEGLQWVLQETHTSSKSTDEFSWSTLLMIVTLLALIAFIMMRR
jgi:hypothetical protein